MNIIVAFPRMEHAKSIKGILNKSGFPVSLICSTGGQILTGAEELGMGIVVCGPRFADMMYDEVREYLPEEFSMLLLASRDTVNFRSTEQIVSVSMPLQVHELIQTMEMMTYRLERRRKKKKSQPHVRTKEEEMLLSQAKNILMERNNFTEEEAHRYIQKNSMDSGNSLMETAQMIISMMAG